MSDRDQRLSRRTVLQYTAVLGAGLAAGTFVRRDVSLGTVAGAATPDASDATATREAELAELHDLQTQVANPLACTPAPTATSIPATATPTQVPLAQTGVPLLYLNLWTITVLGIAPTPGSQEVRPAGQFMQVNLTVAHSDDAVSMIPHLDFRLTDSAGRLSVIDQAVNRALLGNAWLLGVSPGVTETRAWIFDVAADAGDSFVLESNADPTFRVALKVEQRG